MPTHQNSLYNIMKKVDSIRNKYYNELRQVNLINSLIDCENNL